MNPSMFTPFVRYGLMALASSLLTRGWISLEAADTIANDPAILELAMGLLTGVGTLLWYMKSTSRSALRDLVGWWQK